MFFPNDFSNGYSIRNSHFVLRNLIGYSLRISNFPPRTLFRKISFTSSKSLGCIVELKDAEIHGEEYRRFTETTRLSAIYFAFRTYKVPSQVILITGRGDHGG